MKRKGVSTQKLFLLSSCIGAGVLAGNALMATPAAAALPNCNTAFLTGLKAANVTVTSATDVAAAGANPEYCQVVIALVTDGDGAGQGLAHVQIKMPASWNNRFLFLGCGGECGSIASTSAESVDTAEALPQGYAVVNTDTGHTDPTDAWTLISTGVPNTTALVDFYYRAVHQGTVAAKALVKGYYQTSIDFSYFDGCSTGGRQALVEADRYPDDFDGIIAGDPVMAFPETLLGHLNNLKIFAPADAYLPPATVAALDAAVKANCDAADGVADGLIQNPAKCTFNPHLLVPSILTKAQAKAVDAYLSPITDSKGRLVFPGYSESDLSTVGFVGTWTEENCPAIPGSGIDPWAGETTAGCSTSGPNGLGFSQPLIATMTELNASFDVWDDFPFQNGVISTSALRDLRQTIGLGSSDKPQKAAKFLRRGGKLIQFHGFSDPSVAPYQSIWFYNGLTNIMGGIDEVQKSARLFMVPGMGHCSGGPGPNTFDTLGALDAWVARDTAPDGIIATNTTSGRSMPLCKFPEEAGYLGGDVNKASSWTCKPRDTRMLQAARDGKLGQVNASPDPDAPRATAVDFDNFGDNARD